MLAIHWYNLEGAGFEVTSYLLWASHLLTLNPRVFIYKMLGQEPLGKVSKHKCITKAKSPSPLHISGSRTSSKYVTTGSAVPRASSPDAQLQKQTLYPCRCAYELSIFSMKWRTVNRCPEQTIDPVKWLPTFPSGRRHLCDTHNHRTPLSKVLIISSYPSSLTVFWNLLSQAHHTALAGAFMLSRS